MKRQDVISMAEALQQVAEGPGKYKNKGLDPLDKEAVRGKFDDRADKDINNDGKVDGSDKYLHRRRKAITTKSSASKKDTQTDVTVHEKLSDEKKALIRQASGGSKGGKIRPLMKLANLANRISRKEEVETVDELSKKTLGSYTTKSAADLIGKGMQLKADPMDKKNTKKLGNRYIGIGRSVKRLTKEAVVKKTPLERYKEKSAAANGTTGKTSEGDPMPQVSTEAAYSTTGPEAMKMVSGPAKSIQGSKEVKQPREVSNTKDTGKLTKVSKPTIVDGEDAIEDDKRAEKISAQKATKAGTDDVNKKPTVKEEVISEDYHSVQMKYLNQLTSVASQIASTAKTLYDGHMKAEEAQKKMSVMYASNKKPSDALRAQSYTGKMYDVKYTVRSLEDALDNLQEKLPSSKKESVNMGPVAGVPTVAESRFGDVIVADNRKPVSMRDALAMMETGDRKDRYRGATPPQSYTDTWAPAAKAFANKHPVDDVDAADINKVVIKNKQEVGLSLQRAVNYRHNDNRQGDKKPVGNDGK